MTEREKFEAWLKPQFNNEIDFEVLIRKCGARYANNTTEFQWDAWQARAAQDEWISVEDELPDTSEPVVYLKKHESGRFSVGIAYWTVSSKWNPEMGSEHCPEGFTHWKPLPEGPKE